jgi:hypothetical protein
MQQHNRNHELPHHTRQPKDDHQATKPAQVPDAYTRLKQINNCSHDLKALFWLKGALHKRADHATCSSVGQLKHIVGEKCHRCTSLRIDIRKEGNTQADRRQIGR